MMTLEIEKKHAKYCLSYYFLKCKESHSNYNIAISIMMNIIINKFAITNVVRIKIEVIPFKLRDQPRNLYQVLEIENPSMQVKAL